MEGGKSFFKKGRDFEFKCSLSKEAITINGKLKKQEMMFASMIKAGALPPSFTNIFDHIDQFYSFLEKYSEEEISIEGNTMLLKIRLEHLAKTKVLEIPIKSKPFGREEKAELEMDDLKERVEQIEEKLSQNYIQAIVQNYLKKRMNLQETNLKLETDKKTAKFDSMRSESREQIRVEDSVTTCKKKGDEPNLMRPNDPFAKLSSIKEGTSQQGGRSEHELSFQQSTSREVLNNTVSSFQDVELGSMMKDFSTREFTFEVDLRNPNIDAYIVSKKTVVKKVDDGRMYMVYSMNPIPERYRHNIYFKFIKISPKTSAAFGLITEEKKVLQYVYKEKETISMGFDQGYQLYVDSKPQEKMLSQMKDNTMMEIQVDIRRNRIRFYKHGDHQTPYAKLEIPESMKNKKLYPFFQLTEKGDTVQIARD